MQDRYGTKSPGRRRALVVATTVLAAVFLGWLVWAAWFSNDTPIDAEVASYRVVGEHEVDVRLQTRLKDEGVQGSCLIRATASDHTIVGEANLTVAAIKAANGGWIPITTLSRATTVQKISCTEHD
jgi:hypothetical protein